MQTTQHSYNLLSYYTLGHEDPSFIHQHIVDAFAAQMADEHTKPVKITFALAGLYLYIEKKFSGKQVQRMHMQMAKTSKKWPLFDLPKNRGEITVFDVMAAEPGEDRDKMIRKWCISVWSAYDKSHNKVADLLDPYLK
jgi:hypothetical protein